MKLLKKSTLNIELAQQRKAQIDEGLLIARKVDALRTELSRLQEQHSKFIAGMETELKKQTEGLIREIAIQQLEIVQLTEKRKKLLEPLDDEWKKLAQRDKELTDMKVLIEKGLTRISEKEKKTEEKYQKSKAALARINVRERELTKVYEKAEDDVLETESTKVEALDKMAKVDEYISLKTKELETFEADLLTKERELEISAMKIIDDRKALSDREILLKDREETLERELKR